MTLKRDIAEAIVEYMFECEDYDRGVSRVQEYIDLYVTKSFDENKEKCSNCDGWNNNGFWCRDCESYMKDCIEVTNSDA